ncbi:MAG: HNH endonuclease [Marivivens sp.]|nr:HNH endonuclease [Marivivens sp.]
MSRRPLRACCKPGCKELVRASLCEKHAKEREKNASKKAERKRSDRPTAHQRGYTHRWHKARTGYLRDNPLCVRCEQEGELKPANVVDHIKPHKGNQELFWDTSNWQSLCKLHHDRKTFHEDGGRGFIR